MELFEGFYRDTFYYKDKNSFLYKVNSKKGSKAYLRCIQSECQGTCVVDDSNGQITHPHEHYHPASLIQVEELKFLAAVRLECAKTNDMFKDIFSRCQRKYEDGAIAAGSLHQVVTIMKGARKAKSVALNPKSLREFATLMQSPE